MRYVAKKLPGGCAVIPCDYMMFPRLLIPEEGLTLKLTSKCFISREKVTYTFNITSFFFNET